MAKMEDKIHSERAIRVRGDASQAHRQETTEVTISARHAALGQVHPPLASRKFLMQRPCWFMSTLNSGYLFGGMSYGSLSRVRYAHYP
jgi:hypothetical protein